MNEIIVYALFVIGGFILGIIVSACSSIYGYLIVDTSNPNTDYYRLEIDNLDDIPKKKRIVLKVKNSHK